MIARKEKLGSRDRLEQINKKATCFPILFFFFFQKIFYKYLNVDPSRASLLVQQVLFVFSMYLVVSIYSKHFLKELWDPFQNFVAIIAIIFVCILFYAQLHRK